MKAVLHLFTSLLTPILMSHFYFPVLSDLFFGFVIPCILARLLGRKVSTYTQNTNTELKRTHAHYWRWFRTCALGV
jgi:uncharacterized membrane protein